MQREILVDYYRRSVVTMAFWRAIELHVLEKHVSNLAGKIVDIACGDGLIASLAFGNTRLAVGYDVEKQSVEKASMTAYEAVVVADARNTPFRDGSFDGLFSNSAVEHFPEIDRCFRELNRVTKVGSGFLFTAVSGSFYDLFWCSRCSRPGLRNWVLRWMQRHRRLRQHLNVWHLDAWRVFLERHGFSLVAHEYYLNPRTMFWWSLLEDAHTWPFGIGTVVAAAARLTPRNVLLGLVDGLVVKDRDLCTKYGNGAGLLLLARKEH